MKVDNDNEPHKNQLFEATKVPFNFNQGINIEETFDLLWDLATGDLDNDGDVDIIGSYGFTDAGSLKCYENDGTPWGTWSSNIIGTKPQYNARLAVGDLNGDKNLDVISTFYSTMYIWPNKGTPWDTWGESIEIPAIGNASEITDIKVNDIDGDNRLDIITVQDEELYIWRNLDNTAINFTRHKAAIVFPDSRNYYFDSQIRSMAIEDMDNDGDSDIIITSEYTDEFLFNVTFWENDGSPFDNDLWESYVIQSIDGRIGNFGYLITPMAIPDVETVDMNKDGYIDIISGDAFGNIIIWFNTGSIKSKVEGTYVCKMNRQSEGIEVGDLDRDGDMDIISVNQYESLVAVENPGKNHKSVEWEFFDIGDTSTSRDITMHLVDLDGDLALDVVCGYGILIWENIPEIDRLIKNYDDIYSYNGSTPEIDGKVTSNDNWDKTPASLSSFDDGDIIIRSKHDNENLYFLIQWSDLGKIDDHFDFNFEDDGTNPDHKLDSENEDFKYGWLAPDGGEISYRDGYFDGSSWPIDGGWAEPEKNICYFGSRWNNGEWTFEAGFPLNLDNSKDINVTGDEVLGFIFRKSSGGSSDISPSSAEYKLPETWADLHIEYSDGDKDKDGCFDCSDAFPDDPDEWQDTDKDGKGDTSDPDDDNDGHNDIDDDFPIDSSEWKDTDGDGVGDNSDAFPEDETEWLDTDGDEIGDNKDKFPFDSTEWLDTDNDEIGDNSDVFPTDPNEWFDNDGDEQGDNADLDDDNDGYSDIIELYEGSNQFDSKSIPKDQDLDLIPDYMDDDIDGDGVLNEDDAFPYDNTKWTNSTDISDFDEDGLPDSWEMEYFGNLTEGPNDDFDDDGYTNKEEYMESTDPTSRKNNPKTNQPDSALSGYSIAIIAILIVVILVLVFLGLMKKRKKVQEQNRMNKIYGIQTNQTNVNQPTQFGQQQPNYNLNMTQQQQPSYDMNLNQPQLSMAEQYRNDMNMNQQPPQHQPPQPQQYPQQQQQSIPQQQSYDMSFNQPQPSYTPEQNYYATQPQSTQIPQQNIQQQYNQQAIQSNTSNQWTNTTVSNQPIQNTDLQTQQGLQYNSPQAYSHQPTNNQNSPTNYQQNMTICPNCGGNLLIDNRYNKKYCELCLNYY
jgi:hypothetical protein